MNRLCSDFAAGSSSMERLELGAAELLRLRVGCDAISLWTRDGRGAGETLRCAGRLVGGEIDPVAGRPVPVPASNLAHYLPWMRSARYLLQDSPDAGDRVVAEAWQFHCDAAVAFLHVPTFYNGELRGVACFSDHARPIPWAGALRRDVRELISLMTLYLCPSSLCERPREIVG